MRLYRYNVSIGKEVSETFIRSFKTEKEAFGYMADLESHMVKFGYEVKSKDLDHLIVEKDLNGVTISKRFELE